MKIYYAPCIAFMSGNVFPFLSAMEDGMIEMEVWYFKFYVYVHVCMCVLSVRVCVFIQQHQRRCKLRVTDRDQAGTDLINRYLALM